MADRPVWQGRWVAEREIHDTRRWLWEQFYVAAVRRPPAPPLVREVWGGDAASCAKSLQAALAQLVVGKRCLAADALAWGRAASLEGKKIPRSEIARLRDLSPNGLEYRLKLVDRTLAEVISAEGIERFAAKTAGTDGVLLNLVQAALARARSLNDLADGLYAAAANAAHLPEEFRVRPIGGDRSKRNRTRLRAEREAQFPVTSADLERIHNDTVASMVISSSRVENEPDLALQQLEDTWRRGDLESLPLMLRTAIDLVPDARVSGRQRWRWLLEVESNIFRDAESLTALASTALWVQTAEAADAQSLRARVNGHKTRAHVLQLHGFLEPAAAELDLATNLFRNLDSSIEDYELLRADLLVRRAAVDLLQANFVRARQRLQPVLDTTEPRMLLSAKRHQLHIESSANARTRQRRSFGRMPSGYSSALDQLMASEAGEPIAARLTVLDTVIASASRVEDVQTIQEVVAAVDWSTATAAPNVLFRLEGRLRLAARLPGLRDLEDITLPPAAHPFRRPGLTAQHLEFLL